MAYEPVEHELREALALAEALEMRPLAARCHLRLAWLSKRAGHGDREAHQAAARSLLEEMGGHITLSAADREALA